MESASGAEGEVRCAGQVDDRGEVDEDEAPGYNPPAEGRNHWESEWDGAGVPVGKGAKGPDRFRATRGDRPRAPRRRQTVGLVGTVQTPPGNRRTALRRIAQHHCLAATRATLSSGRPTWPRTKRWN
jgi:hypothetical protein